MCVRCSELTRVQSLGPAGRTGTSPAVHMQLDELFMDYFHKDLSRPEIAFSHPHNVAKQMTRDHESRHEFSFTTILISRDT